MSTPKLLLSPEAVGLASVGAVVVAGAVLGLRYRRRQRPGPAELEARRRAWLAVHGKLGGGEILDVHEHSISYLYEVRGIGYTALQDVSALETYLPADRWSIIGGVGVRYDPRNPANSIVLSETWSGLRPQSSKAE